MKQIRGQAAIEFLIVVGVSLILIVPALVLFSHFAKDTTYKTIYERVNKVGNIMIETVESTYYYGDGAKEIVGFDFPQKITNLEIINDHELVFTLQTEEGPSDASFYSPYEMSATFTETDYNEGFKRFQFMNVNNIIVISELDG